MSYRRTNYEPTAYDDDFEDIPASGPAPKWIGGIVVPLFLIGYGITCCADKTGELPGNLGPMVLHGRNAVALGLASCSGGVMLHCHYFWGNIYHLSACAVVGKIVSLIVLIVSLGYILVHVGVLGH